MSDDSVLISVRHSLAPASAASSPRGSRGGISSARLNFGGKARNYLVFTLIQAGFQIPAEAW